MTIKDIAKLSGYAVSTVSRALNGHPDINSETKAKIEAIVEEYNYVPNQNARSLKQNVSKSIVLIVKGTMNMFFSNIIEHIQLAIGKSDINAMVHYINEKQTNEVLIAQRFVREQKPIGIIFLGGNLDNFEKDFSKIKVPCVLSTSNARELKFKNLSSVSVDDFNGGKNAIDYLLEKGHKNIGIINGDFKTYNPSKIRYNGCLKSFKNHGINVENVLVQNSEYTLSSSYNATKEMILKNKDLSAIFAMSDIMAIGAVRAIIDMGKNVPKNISVVGFDGIEISQYFHPKITTIVQPSEKIAQLSVKILIEMIDRKIDSTHITLEAKIREGESVNQL